MIDITAGELERTWRPPVLTRLSPLPVLMLPVGFGGLLLWWWFSSLTGGHGKTAGWLDLGVMLTVLGWLAGRAWSMSATLAWDELVIRNVFTTKHVPLADITRVGFRKGVLRASTSHVVGQRTVPGRPVTVRAVRLGTAYWTGRFCAADRAADTIAAAAGLSLLPPRRVRISRRRALLMLPASIAATVAFILLFLPSTYPHLHPIYGHFATALLGAGVLSLRCALEATADYCFAGPRRIARGPVQ
jgi:hypothetical protein